VSQHNCFHPIRSGHCRERCPTNTELRTQNYEHRTTNTECDSYRHSHRAAPPTAFSRGPCRRSKETPLLRDSPGRKADHRAVRRSPLPSPVTWVSRIPPAGAVLGREQGYHKAPKPRQVYRCSRCRCSRRSLRNRSECRPSRDSEQLGDDRVLPAQTTARGPRTELSPGRPSNCSAPRTRPI